MRRDGLPAALLPPALWHGLAKPEHESGFRAHAKGSGPPFDRLLRPRDFRSGLAHEDRRRSPRLPDPQGPSDLPERRHAGCEEIVSHHSYRKNRTNLAASGLLILGKV